MIEMELEKERVERVHLQGLGEDWILAIVDGRFDRLEQFCQPDVTSRLLTPKRFINFDKAVDLAAKYADWFGDCADIQVEASRVEQVGRRLGIFYRFLLLKEGDWHRIEQQAYCTLRDGRVEQLHLLCSGFQLAGIGGEAAPAEAHESGKHGRAHDALLEFHSEGQDAVSTCALLTPAIKAKLREMQSGQVLEVDVDDPSAKGDVEAWSRLSGNPLLEVIDERPALRFFVQKK